MILHPVAVFFITLAFVGYTALGGWLAGGIDDPYKPRWKREVPVVLYFAFYLAFIVVAGGFNAS